MVGIAAHISKSHNFTVSNKVMQLHVTDDLQQWIAGKLWKKEFHHDIQFPNTKKFLTIKY
jgi:hypothetical protein